MEDYGIYLLIGDYLNEDNYDAIRALTKNFDVIDLAELMNYLKDEEALKLLKSYHDKKLQADIICELHSTKQQFICNQIENFSEIISLIESDDAADLMGYLDKKKQNKVLVSVKTDEAQELRELLQYKKDSAGGIMSKEFVFVRYGAKVSEAIAKIREAAKSSDQIYLVFVVDNEKVLLGYLELNQLLLVQENVFVNDIMKEAQKVHVETNQEEVGSIVKKYNLVELAVVDSKNCLVGRITHDDVLDVIEEESEKDIAYLSGISEEFSEISTQSVLKISRSRIFWLLLGVFGGLVSAVVMKEFEEYLNQFVALSFFVPVIMATGGIVGIQCSTIVVRGLATGEVLSNQILPKLAQEMKVTLINAATCSFVFAVLVYFLKSDVKIIQVALISMFSVMLVSGFLGTVVPIFLNKIKIDPAIATGPFVTILNDIIALTVYFSIAFYIF